MSAAGLTSACNGLLATAAAILGPAAPSRQFVAIGQPAYDCDQLTVHVQSFGVASTSPQSAARDAMRRRVVLYEAVLALTLCRCYSIDAEPSMLDPNVSLPPSSSLQAVADQVHGDVWQLWTDLWSAAKAGTIIGTPPAGCRGVALGQAVPVPEQGALGGWVIPLTVEISGAAGG